MATPRLATRILGLVLLALLASGTSALAHANYVKSVPDADARLTRAPTEVRVSFSEAPELRFSEVQVLDTQGKRVDKGDLSALDPTTLRVSLGTIGEGGYTVAWKVVSVVDGHETRGSFAFAIGDAPLPSVPDIPSAPPPTPLEIIGRFLSYAGAALLIGVPVFSLAIARDREDRSRLRWLRRAGGVAVLAGTAALFAQSGGLALLGARLGWLLAGRAGLAALTLAVTPQPIAVAVGAAIAATLTLQSHAAATDDLVAIALDLAHVLAMGAWAGGLVALAVVVLPRRRAGDTREARELGELVGRFSTLGIAAVVAIVATGALQSLRWLVDVRDLIETPYGLALLAKIVLLAIAVALASLNFLRHGPRLRVGAKRESARMRRSLVLGVRGEVVAVALVLVAASVLTALAPPNTPTGAAYAMVEHAGGLRIELRVQSGIPGRNRWIVRLQDGLRPPADVEKVGLRFTMIEHDMGEQELVARQRGTGEYVADGSPTSMFGTWRTLVVVRRTAHEEARALFRYPVTSTGGIVTRVVQAGSLTLIVYSESPLLSAGQPVTLYVVPLDAGGNLLTDAKLRGSLEGSTYQALPDEGRYRIDLPAQTAGNKKLTLTVATPAGDMSGEYAFSVAP